MLRIVCLVILGTAIPSFGQTCASFNFSKQSPQIAFDIKEHTSGDHQDSMLMGAGCAYFTQSNTNKDCSIECSAGLIQYDTSDNGSITLGKKHKAGDAQISGKASSNGPQITCGAQEAGAVRSCTVLQYS